MSQIFKKVLLIVIVLTTFSIYTRAQSVSSLEITTDPRDLGLGNSSIAREGNAFAIYKNIASSLFSSQKVASSYSFTKWFNKNNLHTLGGYYRINARNSVAAGIRYFDGASVHYTEDGINYDKNNPFDLMLDLGYAYKMTDFISISSTIRYIHSKVNEGDNIKRGNALAFDIGFNYRYKDFGAGLALKGIGSKIDYGYEKYRMPMFLTGGVAYSLHLNNLHQLTSSLELGYRFLPSNNSTLSGGVGIEYMYNSIFVLRSGYRMADKNKTSGNYGVVGCGVNTKYITADFAYVLAKYDSIMRDLWQVSLGVKF